MTEQASLNRDEHICLIVNPKAGAGAAGRNLDALKRAIAQHFERWTVRLTEGPRHATALATEMAQAGGVDIVAAVGGDGTCHEVVNGLMQDERAHTPSLAFTVIPFGTGSDLMKTLEVPSRLSGALRTAATGQTLLSDVGRARVTSLEGEPDLRYFINVAGFGANGEVVRRVNASSKSLGGKVSFLTAALGAAVSYHPAQVRLRYQLDEAQQEWEGRLLSAFIANGAYCGGGMWVGRGGTMQDGKLDLSVLPQSAALRKLLDLRRLYDGHLERAEGVVQSQIRRVEVTARAGEAVYIDLDGELSGQLPARFDILPGVLKIRGGWAEPTS